MLLWRLLAFFFVLLDVWGEDRRCMDPPASNATLLNNCQAIGGFSWNGLNCTYESNAGCAKTRNKFREKEKCLKSCQSTTIDVEKARPPKCFDTPLVFSANTSQRNLGYTPRTCPDEELHSVNVFFYDFNINHCHQSHLKICPGDRPEIFSSTLNSFASLTDCLTECSTLEAKCHQDRPQSESYHPIQSHNTIQFFYNVHHHRCEPFIYIQSRTVLKSREKWYNQFNTYDECKSLCMKNESKASIDKSMPGPKAPKPWQCTDVPALKDLPKNRSCLAYDNSKGYTYVDGQCIPSDYSGCIDTYNKFRDIDLCTQTCLESEVSTCVSSKGEAEMEDNCESQEAKLTPPIRAFTFDAGECVELEFNGCRTANVFLDLGACLKGDQDLNKTKWRFLVTLFVSLFIAACQSI